MKLLAPLSIAAALIAAPASAVVFVEDFSSYGADTVFNAEDDLFDGSWFVTDGYVDYLTEGSTFGGLCPDGGSCIDLDGSYGESGVFSSFVVGPGIYNILFQVAGSGRGTVEELFVAFGDVVRSISLDTDETGSQMDFGLDFFGIKVGPGETTRLTFWTVGDDNIGPILKTAVIEQIAPIPLPAGGALLLGALGLLGLANRRRKAA